MPILTDEAYVDKAEKAIESLKRDFKNPERFQLTTSQLRNLLSLTSHLYDESQSKTYVQLQSKIAYLRVQYVYQSGRENSVKDLVDKAEILAALKEVEKARDIETLQRFCRYIEALVAYFKYYGGKD